jgi:hypothetical protein
MTNESCLADKSTVQPLRRLALDSCIAFGLYAVVLAATIWYLKRVHPAAPGKYLIAALPILPALLIPRALIRYFRNLDELQQKIRLEALAFAFTGTAILTFGYGFLEGVGLQHLSWIHVWPVMAACWVIGEVKATRHYR